MSPFDQDVKSNEFWVQGVIPTVIGVTATLIGFLYMFGVICSGKRRGGVAPTTTNTAATNSDAGSRSRDVDFLDPRISVAEATVKYGPVATEAKLWGMTQAERRQVLEAVFSKLDKKALAKTDKEHTQDESSPTLEEDCLERGDCGVDSNSKHFNNSPGEPSEHSALDMRLSCAICLREYGKCYWLAIGKVRMSYSFVCVLMSDKSLFSQTYMTSFIGVIVIIG